MGKIKNMIIRKLLSFKETEDLMLNYLFFTEEEIDESYPEWVEKGTTAWGNNTPMPIDDALQIIQEMKDKGANFIEMDFHCDHQTYLFSGFEIYKASDEEIEKENELKEEANNLLTKKKIKELKEQLDKLNNEVQ